MSFRVDTGGGGREKGDNEMEKLKERKPKEGSAPSAAAPVPAPGDRWVAVGAETLFPADAGIAVRVGEKQIAVYWSSETDEWFATENHCPHAGYAVLARGLIGDAKGEPKVACPMHKRAFSLRSGRCLSDDSLRVQVYDVRVREGHVEVCVPPT